jgi:hypothetical protein
MEGVAQSPVVAGTEMEMGQTHTKHTKQFDAHNSSNSASIDLLSSFKDQLPNPT